MLRWRQDGARRKPRRRRRRNSGRRPGVLTEVKKTHAKKTPFSNQPIPYTIRTALTRGPGPRDRPGPRPPGAPAEGVHRRVLPCRSAASGPGWRYADSAAEDRRSNGRRHQVDLHAGPWRPASSLSASGGVAVGGLSRSAVGRLACLRFGRSSFTPRPHLAANDQASAPELAGSARERRPEIGCSLRA